MSQPRIIMVADIRVREKVGRVTPCAPSSQRKQTFAPWQRPFGVQRTARPTNASSGDVKPASLPAVPAESSTDCRLAAESHMRDLRDPTFSKRKSQLAWLSGDFADSLASLRFLKP
jgi:hypothetical protein